MPRSKGPTHESVQSKVNRLEDKVDARLDKTDAKVDKVEGKLDAVGFALGDMNSTLARNTKSLEEHMEQTRILKTDLKDSKEATDKRLKHLEESHEAIMGIPDKLMKFAKWVGTITALISLLGGVAHLVIRLTMG